MKKLVAIIVIIVIVLGAGAYFIATSKKEVAKNNGENSKSSPAEKPTVGAACSLVKKSDIESAFGLKFKDGVSERRASTASTACKFDQITDGSVTERLKAISFSIEVDPLESTAAAAESLKTTKSTDRIGDKIMFIATDVPGVGDEAFFFQAQSPGILKTQEYMYARKGLTVVHFVAIKIDGIDHEKARTQIIEIAKKALD